ncbi:Kynureninase [Poseidonocella pacifica]|uniref:Kynureninase n=1 Tax=Poseidonocella pacifica TaxID=871651 RepID=A0A1I0VJS8_9RHOB|nr:kynureninase [Poseidonocella pacifica]SFA76160.1 Kynureninase [Poseidonocella pacifica]
MTDFAATRSQFHLPDGTVYLDGNSLGPMPRAARARLDQTIAAEWGDMLITGWNKAGWMDQPARLGDRIGRLIGAEPGHTVLGDTLSVKVYQALAAALALRPERKVILSDSGNFPSDLYMAQGLIRAMGGTHELRIVAPEEVEAAITYEVAVTMLTEVDYRTGRRHDMPHLTAKAHSVGALALWDLAHSAGAFPVDVSGGKADFAVGCTYKFLNGGPGAPAFIYVAPEHAEVVEPALAGWLGHDAPFAFEPAYRPAPGIARMRVGTPPVLQMAALETALDVWDQVDMPALDEARIALSEQFIAEVAQHAPMLELASPRDPAARGAQVSFRFTEGYAAIQALIARRVIGDFRAPDIMRFGITPLYLSSEDISRAASEIGTVISERLWDTPEYRRKAAVT